MVTNTLHVAVYSDVAQWSASKLLQKNASTSLSQETDLFHHQFGCSTSRRRSYATIYYRLRLILLFPPEPPSLPHLIISLRTLTPTELMNKFIHENDKDGALKPPTGLEGLDSVTLTRFVLHGQRTHKEASGDLTLLLAAVQLACKVTETCVRRAGIAKLYGLAGSGNVQGEDQKKLDIIANDTFKVNIESSERCGVMVSEEDDLAIVCAKSSDGATGKYAIAFDPLDGSSNIDANVSIGTIFSIFRIDNPDDVVDAASAAKAILQPGRQMVSAGYAMYGSATNLVISIGAGVYGFTLDPSLGEFVLTHPNIEIPKRGKIYSVNEGNAKNWDKPTTEYINSLKYPPQGKSSYSLRYIGSMVADVHRTLFYGGVFIYPADKKNPTGKLRLLYEAAPMAFLIEQAGGKAITGTLPILDVVPDDIHQRVPVYMGSHDDITDFESYMSRYPPATLPPHLQK